MYGRSVEIQSRQRWRNPARSFPAVPIHASSLDPSAYPLGARTTGGPGGGGIMPGCGPRYMAFASQKPPLPLIAAMHWP
jgi:hypothetical protein